MAKKNMEDIRRIARYLVERDLKLREAQMDYQRMSRLEYDLPPVLKDFEYIRPIISTRPYDALRGATRAFSNLDEVLYVHPASVLRAAGTDDDRSKKAIAIANDWEKSLQWAAGKAAKRRRAFRSSVMWSSVLYHEIHGQLIHLPTQFKLLEMDGARSKSALRYGDWAVRQVDPKTVHVEYSDYMPERVLSAVARTGIQIVDYWGELAREVEDKIDGDIEHMHAKYIEFDYVDAEGDRGVWVVESDVEASVEQEGITIVEDKPWLAIDGEPPPFLPWLSSAGGIEFEDKPEHQRKPILYPVRQTELWAISNISGAIVFSKALAEANAPIHLFQGAERVRVDHTEPGGRIDLPPGPQAQYQRLRDYGLESSLIESFDRLEDAVSKTTLAEILVTGLPMGGVEAYSAYNLQVQTALASLGDFKQLGEEFYEAMYEKMLLVAHYTGQDIIGYGDGIEKYVIDSEKIDPDSIYIEVELKPDVPTDRVQRVTAARILSTELNYSPQRIYKFLGEADPEGAFAEWKDWQIDLADLQGKLERMQMVEGGQYQQDVMMAAQQLVAQAQQQGPGAGNGRVPQRRPPQEGEQMPLEGMESTLTPPIEASPGAASFEGATETDRAGLPTAQQFPETEALLG